MNEIFDGLIVFIVMTGKVSVGWVKTLNASVSLIYNSCIIKRRTEFAKWWELELPSIHLKIEVLQFKFLLAFFRLNHRDPHVVLLALSLLVNLLNS